MKHPMTLLAATTCLCTLSAPLTAAPLETSTDPLELAPVTQLSDEAADAAELEDDSGGWQWGGGVGLDFCSKQLTYGLIDNPHPILTPSVELSLGHEEYFTIAVGMEAIFDTTNFGAKAGGYGDRRYKYQEFAPGITLSRTWDTSEAIGSVLETAINYTYEYHPKSCKKPAEGFSNPNTQWLNFEIAAPDYWLQPTFAVEYQLMRQGEASNEDGKGGLYVTFSVAHDFDIGTTMGLDEGVLTLTPTLGIGMANRHRNQADFGAEDGNESFMFRDGFGVLELAYTPIENFTIAPYIGFHQQLDSVAKDATGDDDFVAYAGIGLSCSF